MKLSLEKRERFTLKNISGYINIHPSGYIDNFTAAIIMKYKNILFDDRFQSLIVDYGSHEIRFRYFEYSQSYVIEFWRKYAKQSDN